MKKSYLAPQIELLNLQDDVVRTSGVTGTGENTTQFKQDLSPDDWFTFTTN